MTQWKETDGTWKVLGKSGGPGDAGPLPVQGAVADGAATVGNPVLIAGQDGTNVQALVTTPAGRLQFAIGSSALSADGVTVARVTDSGDATRGLVVGPVLFNGTDWDRQRNNVSGTLIASDARTATNSSSDQTNYNGTYLRVYLNVTSAGTGSITLSIEEKDPVSNTYTAVLTGAAVTANSHTVYKVGPGLTASANTVANDVLPRTWRVTVSHNNANSITYSVGYAVN